MERILFATALCASSFLLSSPTMAAETQEQREASLEESKPVEHEFPSGLGDHFLYRDPITIDYNPHGSVQFVAFSWKGKMIGHMEASSLPPDNLLADMAMIKEVGKEHILKKIEELKGTSVAISDFRNAAGCEFQMFRCDFLRDGSPHELLHCYHLNLRASEKWEKELIRKNFGRYQFFFYIPVDQKAEIQKEIDFILDSFRPSTVGKDSPEKK